ncbi:DNA-processing protein DprA [Actinosynnema mirum]|uniref:SMF family protein n=1 Tax=Actinosynnema mirum (strain ATCC 29888 / DSM 43827 / JCM 3225 / NBRC 14064 / NCIMB 13271 / NRRL B-12336 / IMRU 3971 / 101) TaxID=446462 RepID=C6WBB2_ACTMD|nr:DNA-processing protein DprA [Actinosynnema mirum]ACU39403.1 SMF family protein [Actinosynnema mirum DSM 43827]
MRPTEEQLRLLALCKVKDVNWYLIAREAQRPGGVDRLWKALPLEASADATKAIKALKPLNGATDEYIAMAQAEVDKVREDDVRLVTVLDDEFPPNLRLIPNAPPFLFVRGTMTDADLRSVAVVGTRDASEAGRQRAGRMARELVERGVTVVSGLARGIDTAAHTATLKAGGRTIAVIGTGINRYFPAENRVLTDKIATDGQGAVVSQFWPDASGATWTFPRRNITMSGIAQGTVVIEAGSTSGAKMQARVALEHGKKVFLIKSLTEQQEWARKYVETRGAVQVEDVKAVADALTSPERIQAADTLRSQLVMDFI